MLHQLTLTAHQPAFDRETVRLGRDRYAQFVGQAGRLLARRREPNSMDLNAKERK